MCTGVSGSGASSRVFGTITAESWRPVTETYSALVFDEAPTGLCSCDIQWISESVAPTADPAVATPTGTHLRRCVGEGQSRVGG